jgi:hypothetical protein
MAIPDQMSVANMRLTVLIRLSVTPKSAHRILALA